MDTKIERYGPCLLMLCSGDLTTDTLEGFGSELDRQLADEPTDLVLSLERVGFIDSAGLEYLLDLADRMAASSSHLTLTNLPENIRKIMEITRLDGCFEIMDDSGDVLKSLN